MTDHTPRTGPLAGVRILDLSEGIAGPYATTLLGDLGADIIKVERPGGEWGRSAGRSLGDQMGALYVAMNRNKRVIGLDLKHERAEGIVRGLVRDADVLVSNARAGALDRLGLGYEDCRALRPGIVYCSISAFDTRGPYATVGGNDTGLQAMSGFMSLNGEADGPPMRAGIPVVDMTAALFASQAVLAALHTPGDSPARHIELSLLGAAAALQTLAFTEYVNTGAVPGRHGNHNPFIAPAGAFAGCDGRWFTVACLRESHWQHLCEVVDRPALCDDPRFADNARRVEHRSALSAELDVVFAARPAEEWVRSLGDRNVLCGIVNDLPAVVADPGLGPTLPIVGDGDRSTIGYPVRFGGAFPGTARPPTVNGVDTRAILAERGLGPTEIDELIAAGVAHAPHTGQERRAG